MEVEVGRLSLDGQAVQFERATLVEFIGWRVVLVGAAMKQGGTEAEHPVELTISGERYLGTVRTAAFLEPSAAATPGKQTVLRGVGTLRRPGDRAPAQ